LKNEGFLDPATRAVFIDFTVWNSNLGSYAVTRISFEFAPSGAVSNNVRVLIMNERYFQPGGLNTIWDMLQIVGEMIIILFVLWYVAEELSELSVSRWAYLHDGWNILDWANMLLLLYSFGMKMAVFIDSVALVPGAAELANRDDYTNMQASAEKIATATLLNAFNAVLLWSKCFKYTGFIPYIQVLVQAIGGSFTLFASFLAMFSIAFIGFTISFNIGFGDKLEEFSTYSGALIYMGRSFLGDIDLIPIYRLSPLFGAIMILLFYIFVMMVGLNVFFAILANALHDAKYNQDDEALQNADIVTQSITEAGQWIMKKLDVHKKLKALSPTLYRKFFPKKQKDDPKSGMSKRQSWAGNGDTSSRSSYSSSYSSSESQSSWDARQKPVSAFKAREVMASVEHMAGRLLSRIQGMGIEIRLEVLDVYDKLSVMDMAVEELARRTKNIQDEQDALLRSL